MRSVFPTYTIPKVKRATAGALLADSAETDSLAEPLEGLLPPPPPPGEPTDDFADVEAMLAGFDEIDDNVNDLEVFEEDETREILLATWREKRQEINDARKQRNFGKEEQVRKKFRRDVESLKRKTRCHQCKKVGHWKSECPEKGKARGGGKGRPRSSSGPSKAVAFVVHEGSGDFETCMADYIECEMAVDDSYDSVTVTEPEALFACPVHKGVVDPGRGRTLIGENTLLAVEELLAKANRHVKRFKENNTFRFGNGVREKTESAVCLPINLGDQEGEVSAAVVKGDAPLLLSNFMHAGPACA